MKAAKILVIAISLVMVLLMGAPTFAQPFQPLQYKFYQGQDALFNALLAGDIDLMAWPLNYTQYQIASATPDITVAPYFDLGDYEIAYNNNLTDPSHMADRKAMSYTEFRQAISCLIDKDTLIAGPNVNGFGTRIDTQIPRPVMNSWVAFFDSKYDANGNLISNYPWDYSPAKALEILWTNNWYSHATYPTLVSLMAAYVSGLPMGSVHYPPGHPRAGTAIDSIVAYIRSDHLPRLEAGLNLAAEMTELGISVTQNILTSSGCFTPVFINRDYDFYTAGLSFGRFPLHFYSMETPIGIYPGGPNFYMIQDQDLTDHALLEYPMSTSFAQSQSEALLCQDIIVQQAMFVPLYSSAGYIAYRTGTVGVVNSRGYGLTTNLYWTWLGCRVSPYTPTTTIRYGTLNPPQQVNPIFSASRMDYEAADAIFGTPMSTNPYQLTLAGKSPVGGDLPWMAYDWNYQLSNFNGGGGLGDPDTSYTDMANVTFWFRSDITWHDGIPWTVNDFNYTIFLQKTYGDSYGYSDMVHVVNFIRKSPYVCSLYFDIPSAWALYMANYDIVPEHIYKYIAIPAGAPTGTSTTGHHGYWPGAAAVAGEVLPGAPFTLAQLTDAGGEGYTWVGTGMWRYVPGTLVQGVGGGLSLAPYTGFWMELIRGDIEFQYTWNAGSAPQGGSYGIGLSDLVLMANAYGTSGTGTVPFQLGGLNVWNPACDLAAPAGIVGLSDLVVLAYGYQQRWGTNP